MRDIISFFLAEKKMYSLDTMLFNSKYRFKDALYDLPQKEKKFLIYDYFNNFTNLNFDYSELEEHAPEHILESDLYEVNKRILTTIQDVLNSEEIYCAWFTPYESLKNFDLSFDDYIYEVDFKDIRTIIVGVDMERNALLLAFPTPIHNYDYERILYQQE